MTINSEQIQALKAAIDDATQGGWVNESGEGWEAICCDDDQGNAGFIIAEFQGKAAAANRKFVQCANPNTIRSLLAERDADKALIAEQAKRIAELEASTLTVTLPPVSFFDFKLSSRFASGAYVNVEAMNKELAAAGITLVVGE